MFKILCLTSGEFIKLKCAVYFYSTFCEFDWTGIDSSINDTVYVDKSTSILWFSTREAADWFKRRRLVYNKIRTNERKLEFMRSIFKANNIAHWETSKLEFEIIEETPPDSAELKKLKRMGINWI